MTTRVLIVERPGPFREALLLEMSERGVEAHVRDDAMDALASIEKLTPEVVVVSDDPGPPGALGLCRVLQRKLSHAKVYRIGEPSRADQLDERSMLLPRTADASVLAAAIFDNGKARANDNASPAPRAYEGAVGSLELGPLLVAIESRWLTGRLTITRPGMEREIAFVRGLPVHARSSVLSERLGAVAVRRGLLTEAQVEHAVDVARARDLMLGAALIELGLLDAQALMRLLAAQLLEQLSAACNAGATHVRFVIDRAVASRYPLLRMSSMTALLHAVAIMTEVDIASVLGELQAQPLEPEAQAPVERFLADLQLTEAVTGIDSVGALREKLQAAAPAHNPERLLHPDVIALTLLRSGAFHMRKLTQPTHTELGAGVRTLSPPSLVNAAVRCAQTDYSRWPLTEITRSRTPIEQAIDVSLHGKRTPEQARALVLHGPEADCDARYRDVYGLLLRDADPLTEEAGSVSEVRLRCHAQLKRVDALEAENLGGLCRAHLLQTRERIERALKLLPALDPSASASQPEPVPPVEVGYIGPAPAVEREKPADEVSDMRTVTVDTDPRTVTINPEAIAAAEATAIAPDPTPPLTAHERSLLEAAAPLLEQSRWRDLRLLLAQDNREAEALPPVLALLYAVALKEDHSHAKLDPFAAPAGAAESIAISVVRRTFELPEPSVIAVMIAKRLLRRRPLDWKQKPPTRVSAMLVGSALLLGALVGFLLHPSLLGLFWK